MLLDVGVSVRVVVGKDVCVSVGRLVGAGI
jgi:hypothetical protein